MHTPLPNLFIFLDKYNNQVFENNNTNLGIIYRNYNSIKREVELIKISKACKKKRYQLFVSNDLKLALKVRAEGIYIPSFNKKNMYLNLEKKNLMIIGSAHTQKEIQEKKLQKCKAIFLSPIFFLEKSNKYLGIHKFNLLSRYNKVNVFALGGINEKNITKLSLLNIKGFGGIRMFKKKTGLYKAGFFKEKIL